MNTQRALFRTAQVTLGTTHVLLQTLADATLNLEGSIVKRTGYWEDNKKYDLTDKQITQYKRQRRKRTMLVQKHGQEKIDRLSKMIEDKKQLAWK